MSDYDSITEPLKNGDALPEHPNDTTAKRITDYGPVFDADDSTPLTSGLHSNEISQLKRGNQMALSHLYRFTIINNHIYHTRKQVVIHVKTINVE